MAQLSRPYQIGLGAVVALVVVWLVLLQGHSASPATSASSGSAPAVTQVQTKTPAHKVSSKDGGQSTGSSHIYKGSAPGVEGLTKDIARAHGAVATSEENAAQLAQKSAEASSATSSSAEASSTAVTPGTTKAATKPSTTKAASAPTTTKSVAPSASKPSSKANSTTTDSVSRQKAVEAELKAGRTVLILFWNSKAADDKAVEQTVRELRGKAHLDVAVQEAAPGQVALFGSITRGVQVYGTPTLLVVSKDDKVITLAGLQDKLTIEQAIQEARQAS